MQIIHKEETQARILSDGKDREGKLELSINPLDPESLSEGLVNIVSGRVGPATVNVQDSLDVEENRWLNSKRLGRSISKIPSVIISYHREKYHNHGSDDNKYKSWCNKSILHQPRLLKSCTSSGQFPSSGHQRGPCA